MSDDKTGGPAFPGNYTGPRGEICWSDGMTLMDYFAGKALPVAMEAFTEARLRLQSGQKAGAMDVAFQAYQFAEAMVAERARRGEAGK